ncbi:hypothetical protein NP7_04475 [Moraxella osloensis]|uniref:Uncharacterized protein n=1 Tax=Faucicola osloensis TaxID=34062 RepID=A0A2D2LU80_FAUOS|nr:hypothetical protein NP7_04475 [Moraxella osloensis]
MVLPTLVLPTLGLPTLGLPTLGLPTLSFFLLNFKMRCVRHVALAWPVPTPPYVPQCRY